MTGTDQQKPNANSNGEHYMGGYGSLVTKEILAKRTASVEASFFCPTYIPG